MDKYNPGGTTATVEWGSPGIWILDAATKFLRGGGTPILPVLVAEMLPQSSKSPRRAPEMRSQNGVW